MNQLPYKVECKSTQAFYELIAAFNIQSAAEFYAGECALNNLQFSYRVKRGRSILCEFGPEGNQVYHIG